ncbi:transcription factor bHLH144-like [Rhodamnia argentea]|uniref:Transcription factor bHLH144-like n=1 Tax=Rhodamnia argentea TaxID=178133 RepID=A0ABM3HWG8_9MYRT|nr:transcription factor bHLH144-like [Rhodamnia argentea]
MESNHPLPPKKESYSMTNQMSGEYMDFSTAYAFCAVPPPQAMEHLPPVHGLQFQPSTLCPKNFIVFDQTAYQSRIMFHPAIAPKFGNPGFQSYPTYVEKKDEIKCAFNEQREVSFSDKEDSDDIDALLSLEEEEDEEYDEDEVSTARTNGNYGSSSPDSCSSYRSKTRKLSISSLLQKSSGGTSSSSNEPKQQKMKKMVKALRGIIPGGNQMSTVTLFDEAVRYLKTLKIEAEKLGDFKD